MRLALLLLLRKLLRHVLPIVCVNGHAACSHFIPLMPRPCRPHSRISRSSASLVLKIANHTISWWRLADRGEQSLFSRSTLKVKIVQDSRAGHWGGISQRFSWSNRPVCNNKKTSLHAIEVTSMETTSRCLVVACFHTLMWSFWKPPKNAMMD